MKKNAIALISRIRESAHRLIVRELKAKGIVGIVPSHGDILYALSLHETLTMQEVAAQIHRTKPTVTILVDKLVALGYVLKEKSGKDQRETYLQLTAKGRALKPQLDEISATLNEYVYGGLDKADAEKLEGLLTALHKRLP